MANTNLLKRIMFVDPLYRIRSRREEHEIKVYVFVDTSGSMFSTLEEKYEIPRGVDFALSIAFSVLRLLIARKFKLTGVIGFFSDKRDNFTCGEEKCYTLHEYINLEDKPYVDYLLLRGTTLADLRPSEIRMSITTGGTHPAPLQEYIFKKYGAPAIQFLVTDGYTPPIKTFGVQTVVYIVPGGTKPKCEGECEVVFVEVSKD